MDSGEGRYFNETFGNQQDSVGFYLRKDRIVSGSRVVYDPSTRFEGRGLVDSKTIYHYICKLKLLRTMLWLSLLHTKKCTITHMLNLIKKKKHDKVKVFFNARFCRYSHYDKKTKKYLT